MLESLLNKLPRHRLKARIVGFVLLVLAAFQTLTLSVNDALGQLAAG